MSVINPENVYKYYFVDSDDNWNENSKKFVKLHTLNTLIDNCQSEPKPVYFWYDSITADNSITNENE